MSQQADRRVERTRSALREALIALILAKGYEAITIQDIIDKANIGRSTFYAHYFDKQQLLLASLAELRLLLVHHQQQTVQIQGGLAQGRFGFSLGMFEHAESHVSLYQAMIGKQSGMIVIRELQAMLTDLVRDEFSAALPRGRDSLLPVEAVVHYVVSSYMGLLRWWLDGGLPCPAVEADRLFQTLTIPGVRAALESTSILQT